MANSNKIVLTCNDCGDPIKDDKFFKSFKDPKVILCEECFDELRSTCNECGKKENMLFGFKYCQFFNKENDIDGFILCPECLKNKNVCSDSECRFILNQNFKKCEYCERKYCITHENNHNCTNRTSGQFFRKNTVSKLTGRKEDAKIIKDRVYVGVELECVNGNPSKLSQLLPPECGLEHDGSLKGKNPIEIQTPPASTSELERLIKESTFVLRKAGYKVNKSCGVHIHFDSSNFKDDPKKILKLVNTFNAVEPVIFNMLPLSRRNNRYSLPLNSWLDESKLCLMLQNKITLDDIYKTWYKTKNWDNIEHYKGNKWDSSRYHGYNIHALFKNGNIEMRYHHGSLNTGKILNWINFNLRIHNWALNDYNQSTINSILSLQSPEKKFRVMCRHMAINKKMRKYVLHNMKKFKNKEEDK